VKGLDVSEVEGLGVFEMEGLEGEIWVYLRWKVLVVLGRKVSVHLN
jgi:hypothetical protein